MKTHLTFLVCVLALAASCRGSSSEAKAYSVRHKPIVDESHTAAAQVYGPTRDGYIVDRADHHNTATSIFSLQLYPYCYAFCLCVHSAADRPDSMAWQWTLHHELRQGRRHVFFRQL